MNYNTDVHLIEKWPAAVYQSWLMLFVSVCSLNWLEAAIHCSQRILPTGTLSKFLNQVKSLAFVAFSKWCSWMIACIFFLHRSVGPALKMLSDADCDEGCITPLSHSESDMNLTARSLLSYSIIGYRAVNKNTGCDPQLCSKRKKHFSLITVGKWAFRFFPNISYVSWLGGKTISPSRLSAKCPL